MICKNCGVDAPDTEEFCPYCGERLREPLEDSSDDLFGDLYGTPSNEEGPDDSGEEPGWEEEGETEGEAPSYEEPSDEKPEDKKGLPFGRHSPQKSKKEPKPKKEKAPKQPREKKDISLPSFPQINPKLVPIIAGAVVLVIVIIFAGAALGSRSSGDAVTETVSSSSKRTEVDLTEYIAAAFTGYDGYGEASVSLDYASFMTDFSSVFGDDAADVYYEISSWIYLSKDSALSNGDACELLFDIPDGAQSEIQDAYDVKLSCDDLTFTVSGLEEADTYDPFTKVVVSYTGMDGSGKASVSNSASESTGVNSVLKYEVSPDAGLSNGDTVTVTCTNDVDEIMEEYGFMLDPVTKEYTVSGLSGYITSSDDLTDEVYDKLLSTSRSKVLSYTNTLDSDTFLTGDITCIGNYMLIPRDRAEYTPRIYMVYRVDAEIYYEDTEGFTDEAFTFYYYVGFSDLTRLSDGTLSVDYTNTVTTESVFTFMDVEIYGFDDLDILFSEVVTANTADFTYENNVSDVAVNNTPSIDWTEIPDDAYYYAGHYYCVFEVSGITWEEAKEHCEERGGYLAVITDSDEKEAVQNLLSGYAWVGAYKVAGNTTFKWVNEEEYTYETEEAVLVSDECYLALSASGWNTYKYANGVYTSYNESMIDNSVNFYICEWDAD